MLVMSSRLNIPITQSQIHPSGPSPVPSTSSAVFPPLRVHLDLQPLEVVQEAEAAAEATGAQAVEERSLEKERNQVSNFFNKFLFFRCLPLSA